MAVPGRHRGDGLAVVARLSRGTEVWGWVGAHAAGLGISASARSVCQVAAVELGVSEAWVNLAHGGSGTEPVCASGLLAHRLEELQVTVGEGPCVDALARGAAVLIGELATAAAQRRWPLFAPLAVDSGARAIFALPMQLGAIQIGVLGLYRDQSGGLTAQQLADALVLAELGTRVLLDEQAGLSVNGDPGGGPEPVVRASVHQATGMISVQLGIGLDAAFSRLRARAFVEGQPLDELAADVVSRLVRFYPEREAQ